MEDKKKILVVDDDKGVRNILYEQLKRYGYDVFCYTNAGEALTGIREIIPHLVITDLEMPGMNGMRLCREIKARSPNLPVIIMTGNPGKLEEIPEKPTEEILAKPFRMGELLAKVKRLTDY